MIDVNDGGAAYFTVPISNVWGTTMGIMDRTGSLNKAQSEPERRRHLDLRARRNADPGVHNWVDPCGLTEGILTLRMAEFPDQRPTDDLAASGQVVKLASLEPCCPRARSGSRREAGRAARRARRGLRPAPARGSGVHRGAAAAG